MKLFFCVDRNGTRSLVAAWHGKGTLMPCSDGVAVPRMPSKRHFRMGVARPIGWQQIASKSLPKPWERRDLQHRLVEHDLCRVAQAIEEPCLASDVDQWVWHALAKDLLLERRGLLGLLAPVSAIACLSTKGLASRSSLSRVAGASGHVTC